MAERNSDLKLATIVAGARGRRLRSWLQWGAALTVVGGAALWWFDRDPATDRYVSAEVRRGELTVVVNATGSLQPTNKVDVSSELSGTIRQVLVDYNSEVRTGQLLAVLDTEKLEATAANSRAKLAATRAKVTDAEATVGEKRRDLERKSKLVQGQAVSAQDLDQAQAALDRAQAALLSARADVDAASADLKLNESNLAKAKIVSPIDGVVLTRSVDPGQTVASQMQAPVLLSIAEDLRRMELRIDIDEADVGKTLGGQKASFTVDAFPERRFPAEIRMIRFASETVQGVVTYKGVLTVDNADLSLRPGMTATAEIVVEKFAAATLIPNAALRYHPPAAAPKRSLLSRILPGPPRFQKPAAREETGTARTVYVVREGGEPAPRRIEIGPSDGKSTVVKGGDLKLGEQVVTDRVAAGAGS